MVFILPSLTSLLLVCRSERLTRMYLCAYVCARTESLENFPLLWRQVCGSMFFVLVWETLWFSFTFEGSFHRVWNSRLVVFLPNFKNTSFHLPLAGLVSAGAWEGPLDPPLWRRARRPAGLLCGLSWGHCLGRGSAGDFFFIFDFLWFEYDMSGYSFSDIFSSLVFLKLLGSMLCSDINLGKFPVIIISNNFFCYFHRVTCYTFCSCPAVLWNSLFFSPSVFSLFPVLEVSLVMSSRAGILPSATSVYGRAWPRRCSSLVVSLVSSLSSRFCMGSPSPLAHTARLFLRAVCATRDGPWRINHSFTF